MKTQTLPIVIPDTVELFKSNLSAHPFFLSGTKEKRDAKRLEKTFIGMSDVWTLASRPPTNRDLYKSPLINIYYSKLCDFRDAATFCKGNIKTTALAMGYFSNAWLDYDSCVAEHLNKRDQQKFKNNFDKIEKRLQETIDKSFPEKGQTEEWNAKNFALMAYSEAVGSRQPS